MDRNEFYEQMRKKIEENLPESILAEGELVIKEARRHDARDHDLLHCFPPEKPHFCEALISAIYLLLLSKISCSLRITKIHVFRRFLGIHFFKIWDNTIFPKFSPNFSEKYGNL